MINKRFYLVLILSLFLNSCITSSMWSEDRTEDVHSYFLDTENNDIILIGGYVDKNHDTYHYLIDNDIMFKIFQIGEKSGVKLEASMDGYITGAEVQNHGLVTEDIVFLEDNSFTYFNYNNSFRMRLKSKDKIKLDKHVSAKGMDQENTLLDKKLQFTINEQNDAKDKTIKSILTPFTVATDIILTPFVVLSAFFSTIGEIF
jgi:hypothetical protein